MRYSYLIQKGDSPNASVKALLASEIGKYDYTKLRAAMAYVTVAGVRDLFSILGSLPTQSRWVIGLDDAISQPGAIELCVALHGSQVRVASFEHKYRRFHPKILYLSSVPNSHQSFMMIGSSNLTKQALSLNAESVVLLHSENISDKKKLDKIWRDAWSLGRLLGSGELDSYKLKYDKSKKSRKKAFKDRINKSGKRKPAKVRLVLDDDRAEIDPTTATTCWIECGNVTALGRELEFKAEQGLFFGLNPRGEAPRILKYIVSSGDTVSLRMKYQSNHMWRLQMTVDVPEVASGLRPLRNGKLGRSPWVAVFKKTGTADTYRLGFMRLRSRDFQRLKRRSIEHGTLGRTTAREYGWY